MIRIVLTLVVATGCSVTAVDPGTCQFGAPVVKTTDGLLHGIACQTDAQCKYGVCSKTAMQQGGSSTQGVCTKQCSCGGATSQCSADNDSVKNLSFTCIKAAVGSGSECGVICTSDKQCADINPNQPFCVTGVKGVFTAGALKACSAKPQS